jgi:uncharacterized protein YeaO (DUF488 family)
VSVRVKRVYDEPAKSDGCRVLVDRLWPRGLKKSKAHIHEWLKEIAPSTKLRRWFGHDPGGWMEFKKKYWAELNDHREEAEKLAEEARRRSVTLLFSAKDTEHNIVVALNQYLEQLP